jgi:hypothetical protein
MFAEHTFVTGTNFFLSVVGALCFSNTSMPSIAHFTVAALLFTVTQLHKAIHAGALLQQLAILICKTKRQYLYI